MTTAMIEEALFDILTADAGVSAITTRVYPVRLPQGPTFPAITYQRIAGSPENVLAGASSIYRTRFQIDAWAATYAGSKALAAAIRAALNGRAYKTGTVSVPGASLISDRDFYEEAVEAYRVIMDFYLWHTEA